MHDQRSRSLEKILGGMAGAEEFPISDVSDKERQHVQAFSLRVDSRDGRAVEGFAWAHYSGYRLVDNEDGSETLALAFGQRAVVVHGYNLRIILREIDEGRRRRIKPKPEAEIKLALHSGEKEKELISRVECLPAFDKILSEIKGEEDNDKHSHTRRAAGR
jgi:hypothetical protein